MRKILSILLVISLLLSCGCGVKSVKVNENLTEVVPTVETHEEPIQPEKEVEEIIVTEKSTKVEQSSLIKEPTNMTEQKEPDLPVISQILEKDTVGNTNLLPTSYLTESKLTYDEIKALANLSIDEVRESISTLKDAVTFITQFDTDWYTMMDQHEVFKVDPMHSIEKVRDHLRAGTDDITTLAFYFISDDYDNMGMVVGSFIAGCTMWAHTALAFEVDGGYDIISPVDINDVVTANRQGKTAISQMRLNNLTELPIDCGFNGAVIGSWHYIDHTQTLVKFDMNTTDFNVITGKTTIIYSDNSHKRITEDDLRQDKIDFAKLQISVNWDSYGIPNTEVRPSWDEAKSWGGLSLEEADKQISSIADLFYYFAAVGYNYGDPGVDVKLVDEVDSSLCYHFNTSPQVTYSQNFGCCGATAGLTYYMLDEDYEEVGIIDMTFPWGEGGGHVISYVKDNGKYYVFDPVNLTGSYTKEGLNFCIGNTLEEAGKKWAEKCPWNVVCMRACAGCSDGDSITAWRYMTDDHKTYLPINYLGTNYQSTTTIIIESPEEGYVYEWVDISDSFQNQIHIKRNR